MAYIVHELGHVVDCEIYNYKQNKKHFNICDLYEEVSSCMFEISFLDYLYKNRIESRTALELINFRFLNNVVFYDMYKTRLRNEYYFTPGGYILDEENGFGKCIDTELDNFRDDFIYFLGYTLGLNFMLNSDNREKSMKEFTNFLCMRKENTFKQSIETLGLNYDEFLACTLIKPYIKEKNNELIRRYK